MSEPVAVTREIAASPEHLYAMVSDLQRMVQWSPENKGGKWLDDAGVARPGARFGGQNRNGRKSWNSLVTVTDAEPGRRFSFRVTVGPVRISDWSYTFESAQTGCRVTEFLARPTAETVQTNRHSRHRGERQADSQQTRHGANLGTPRRRGRVRWTVVPDTDRADSLSGGVDTTRGSTQRVS